MRFTCLLPVHAADDAAGFARAFASVMANSLQPSVILLCQDGPLPEPVGDAVAQTGAEVVVNPGPMGLHYNLNHALARVDTPWVCRADADDLNLADRFERQAAFLAVHADVDVLGGAIVEVSPDGRRRVKPMPLTHDAIAGRARWRNPINHMTAFMRTEAVTAAGGYPAIPHKEDYGLWIAMLARGARFANLPDVLVEAQIGHEFHARRSGFENFSTERALYRLGDGTPSAALVHAARALALSTRLGACAVYRGVLRR
jgi:hypothetical protein